MLYPKYGNPREILERLKVTMLNNVNDGRITHPIEYLKEVQRISKNDVNDIAYKLIVNLLRRLVIHSQSNVMKHEQYYIKEIDYILSNM